MEEAVTLATLGTVNAALPGCGFPCGEFQGQPTPDIFPGAIAAGNYGLIWFTSHEKIKPCFMITVPSG